MQFSPISSRDDSAILKAFGLHRTKDRQALLRCFRQRRTWSHAQLSEELSETDPSTITRNLQLFREKGIIAPVHVHDAAKHYELADRDHHDHLVCERCHTAECVDCPSPTIPKHSIELFGLCSSCTT